MSSYSCLVDLVKETIRKEISLKNNDVYISSTDEMLVKFSHVVAYLYESEKLQKAYREPEEGPAMGIGFLR